MPARSRRSVALAASLTLVVGLAGTSCTSSDGDDAAADSTSVAAATTTSAAAEPAATDAPPSGSDPAEPAEPEPGVALDVSAGGPYEAEVGATLSLTAAATVSGQSDTVADLVAIGAALAAYRDEHGTYPPAFLTDATGTPTVSWRVLLLPFLDQSALYEQFDLTKPWDDPANLALVEEIPEAYSSDEREAAEPGDTAYGGVAGAKHFFREGSTELAGGVAPSFITDGDQMTIVAGPVGADVSIPWSAPGDVDTNDHDALGDPAGFTGPGGVVTPLLFLDGTVRTYTNDLDEGTLRDWSTIAGDACSPPSSLDLDLYAGWDFDADGEADAYGMSIPFPTDEPGDYEVELTVDDGLGGLHSISTTVTVS